ncbi:MAG: hypothetical protein GY904_10105 [Planctomycetaceae bacterium]|nr:hypothetical protein [Planctomycetaceae bacterium]
MATFTKVISVLTVLLSTLSTAQADTYHYIDGLALTIERQSKHLLRECVHYRHAPEYRHLIHDSIKMSRLADHVHDLARRNGSLAHLESDLAELDALFYHLQSLVSEIERRAACGYPHRHTPSHTAQIQDLMRSIERNIQHLADGVRPLRAIEDRCRHQPIVRREHYPNGNARHSAGYYAYPRYDRVYPPVRSRSSGFGISIGGGSSRFTLRF